MSRKRISQSEFIDGLTRDALTELQRAESDREYTAMLLSRLGTEVAWRATGRRPGRPEYPTLDQVREAKKALRSQGKRGTREEVAADLQVDIKSVKKRAREAGGWRQV